MPLSPYHEKYKQRPEEDMQQRIRAKEHELDQIINQIPFNLEHYPVRIAILGCGERRFVKAHRDIFFKLLKKPVIVTTFDISIEHLLGESDVVQHDCTLPLPNTPYDIIYSSVLLKFIEIEKQWDVIKNSYEGLGKGGIAIHLLDTQDYSTPDPILSDGYYSVPLIRWKDQLDKEAIKYKEMIIKTGPTLQTDALAFIIFHD